MEHSSKYEGRLKTMSTTTKKETQTTSAEETIQNEPLVEQGKRGVTNRQMHEAIMKHKDNDTNLNALFEQYPDIFISTAKYLPPETRCKALFIIQTVFPNFKIAHRGEDRLNTLIDNVKRMVADKADKNQIIDVIVSNNKKDIRLILAEIL